MWQNLFISLSLSAGIGMCCLANAVPDTTSKSIWVERNIDVSTFSVSSTDSYIFDGQVDDNSGFIEYGAFTYTYTRDSVMYYLFNQNNSFVNEDPANNGYFFIFDYYTSGGSNQFLKSKLQFFYPYADNFKYYNPTLQLTYYLDDSVTDYSFEYYLNGQSAYLEANLITTSTINLISTNYSLFTDNNGNQWVYCDLPLLRLSSSRTITQIDFDFTTYKANQDIVDAYNTGYTTGQNSVPTDNTDFLDLFASIADTPILFIHGLFSFDLFGTSMLVIVLTLLTALIVVGLIKKFWK